MDPISAVGFAASLLTFVDFSWSLVTGTCEVYRSATGTTVENAHIGKIIGDLLEVTDDLHTDLGQVKPSKHTKHLRRLAHECSELSQKLLALLRKLKRQEKKSIWKSFKVRWDSMRKSEEVKSLKDDLEDYRSQILLRLNLMLTDEQDGIKTQLNRLHAEAAILRTDFSKQLLNLRDELLRAIEKKEEELDSNEEPLHLTNDSQQTILNDNSPESEEKEGERQSFLEIKQLLVSFQLMATSVSIQHRILRQLAFDSMYSREDMIQRAETGTYQWILEEPDKATIPNSQKDHWLLTNTHLGGSDEDYWDDLLSIPSNLTENRLKSKRAISMLARASFSVTPENESRARDHRKIQDIINVDDAGDKTGSSGSETPIITTDSVQTWEQLEAQLYDRWFREEVHRKFRTRSLFLTWLRDGSHLFHTSGKAGSGKSTLMKFLWQHPRTKLELEAWAHPKKLVFAHFYFWKSAKDKRQMTLHGLYRSILYEILSQCPDLMPVIFPRQWQTFYAESGAGDKRAERSLFRESMIKEAFDILVTKTSYKEYRFCFFIDGLDEFESDAVAHWQLARDLQNWASGDDIKIYTSSRPHSPFLVTFADEHNVMIHLHDLTRHDIYLFSRQMFEKDPNFKEVEDSYLELVVQIVEMSEGVFLWAWLVVRLLLSSIGQSDEFHVLQQKLNAIPRGLDELYEQLLSTIGNEDRCRSDEILLLTLLNPFPEPLNVHVYGWLDDLKNPHFPPVQAQHFFSEEELEIRRLRIQRQLDGLTKGLLEVTPSNRRSKSSFFQWQVQFFHLTVRDFLRSKSELFSSSLRHFHPEDWYSRLRLAEFVFGSAAQTPQNIPIKSLDDPANPETFLIHTFKHLGRSFGSNQWSNCQLVGNFARSAQIIELSISQASPAIDYPGIVCTMWSDGGSKRRVPHLKGSLLHIAAYYNLQECVLYEVSKDMQLLMQVDYTSILFSAIAGGNSDLVACLLQYGALPEAPIFINHRQPEGGWETRGVPVWMVAVIQFLDRAFTLETSHCTALELFLETKVRNECFLILENSSDVDDQEVYIVGLAELLFQHKSWQAAPSPGAIKLMVSWPSEGFLESIMPWLTTSLEPPAFAEPLDLNMRNSKRFNVLWICWRGIQLRTDSDCRIW